MRPTVTEQLDGMCRILEDVIAPEVRSDHAAEILRGLISNVRMLSRNWSALLPFLHWDNEATASLLRDAQQEVHEELRHRIHDALAAPIAEANDTIAAEMLNEILRGLLVDCIAANCSAPLLERMMAHMNERATRYPMRLTGATPKNNN
jgi:hypothetical protein